MTVVWTPELDAELLARRARREPYTAIARALGLTLGSAIGRAWRIAQAQPVATGSEAPVPVPTSAALPGRGECAWPFGHPGDPGFRFCGEPIARPGRSYCAGHMAAAYGRRSLAEGEGE